MASDGTHPNQVANQIGAPGGLKPGRPLGTKNKLKFIVADICKDNDCNPFEILAQIATGRVEMTEAQAKYFSIKLRKEAAEALCPYLAPTLKSIDISTENEKEFKIYINTIAKENGIETSE